MTTRRPGAIWRPLVLFIALASLLALGSLLPACTAYNTLVEKEQTANQRAADLEAALQRRSDLVPNLVAVVKGAAQYEKSTLEAVTAARAQATSVHLTADDLSDPTKMAAFQQAQDQLSSALSRLLVVQERYPELKANASFRDLVVELEGTENRILRAREQYNEAARDYNAALSRIGGMAVNAVTGRRFKPRVYYAAAPGSQVAPQVTF